MAVPCVVSGQNELRLSFRSFSVGKIRVPLCHDPQPYSQLTSMEVAPQC